LENDSSRIGVYIRDCLEQLEIIKRTVINPNNPRDFLRVLVGETANTTRQ
jgi:hypothetical protein